MTFPNAANGLKKIYVAEILALVAALCTGLMLIVTAFTVSSAQSFNLSGALTGGIFLVFFGFGAFVLLVLALIFNMIGISSAKKDETGEKKNFGIAFICVIVSICCSVLGGLLSTPVPALATLMTTAGRLLDLCATYFILYGIADFAEKLGKTDLAENAKAMVIKLCILYCVSIVCNTLFSFISAKVGMIVSLIISLGVLVFSIVYYILYLRLIKEARDTFANS